MMDYDQVAYIRGDKNLKKCSNFFQKDKKNVEQKLDKACELIKNYKKHCQVLETNNQELN